MALRIKKHWDSKGKGKSQPALIIGLAGYNCKRPKAGYGFAPFVVVFGKGEAHVSSAMTVTCYADSTLEHRRICPYGKHFIGKGKVSMITRVCAWCKKLLGNIPDEKSGISHGCCESCRKAYFGN
jgi:hypothetical protein